MDLTPTSRPTAETAPPATRNARRGARCIGRYQVLKLLGEGSMGRVYLARDPELAREVAIKVLRLESAGNARESYIARFRNEARAAARFNHPNVVAVYDAGEDPTLGPFVVYEFIEGESLRPRLERERVDPQAMAKIARGVAAALDALHAVGIVHRDIKPDNILLGANGLVKVTDLGIARVPDATLTREGQFLGTPAYAAPEAISRGEYSERADVFSLAAVIFEALTGTRPFPGDEAVAVSYSVVNDEAPPATKLLPTLPAAIDAVLLKGLSKRAADRHASARELAEDFANAVRAPRPSRTPARAPARPAAPKASWTTMPPAKRIKLAKRAAPFALGALALLILGAAVRWGTSEGEATLVEPTLTAPTAPVVASPSVRGRTVRPRALPVRGALTAAAATTQPRRP